MEKGMLIRQQFPAGAPGYARVLLSEPEKTGLGVDLGETVA